VNDVRDWPHVYGGKIYEIRCAIGRTELRKWGVSVIRIRPTQAEDEVYFVDDAATGAVFESAEAAFDAGHQRGIRSLETLEQ
jgi:hypothetical protein